MPLFRTETPRKLGTVGVRLSRQNQPKSKSDIKIR